MVMFKVGDRVRLKRNSTNRRNDLKKGDIGTIIEYRYREGENPIVTSEKGSTIINYRGLELINDITNWEAEFNGNI